MKSRSFSKDLKDNPVKHCSAECQDSNLTHHFKGVSSEANGVTLTDREGRV